MATTAVVVDRPAPGRPSRDGRSCDVRAELVAAGHAWSSAQHRLVHLAVELDLAGTWAIDGSRTCAHWIATALDIEISTAREWLRVGRALGHLPTIDQAFAARRLSYSKVRLLTRVATHESEVELAAIAERTPAGRLAREIARWLAGREEPEEMERRQHAARSLTWHTEPDGTVVATLRLPPEVAAVPRVAIDTWIMRRASLADPVGTVSDEDASADARSARSVSRWPSVAQQRADGMVAGCVDCRSTELLQHDHVPGFGVTKRTLVDELEERWWPCHRARHA